jgi:hypothetical protein
MAASFCSVGGCISWICSLDLPYRRQPKPRSDKVSRFAEERLLSHSLADQPTERIELQPLSTNCKEMSGRDFATIVRRYDASTT